jgi:hypothetical protein
MRTVLARCARPAHVLEEPRHDRLRATDVGSGVGNGEIALDTGEDPTKFGREFPAIVGEADDERAPVGGVRLADYEPLRFEPVQQPRDARGVGPDIRGHFVGSCLTLASDTQKKRGLLHRESQRDETAIQQESLFAHELEEERRQLSVPAHVLNPAPPLNDHDATV